MLKPALEPGGGPPRTRRVPAAFRKAGQVCTSVQRIYLHESIREPVTERLAKAVSEQRYGDPQRPDTLTGPLVDAAESERVVSWIESAVTAGASALTRAHHEGPVVAPTVLTDVSAGSEVMCQEGFGPVVSLRGFADLEAIDEVK